MEDLGQIVRSPLEAIRVSLRQVGGQAQVELRVHARASPGEAYSAPSGEAIALPVGLLPALLRVLTRAQELLVERSLISLARPAEEIPMEEALVKRGALTPRHLDSRRADARRDPRVRVRLPVECRLVNAARSVTGEIKDVSLGGAQLGLPIRLPLFTAVGVTMTIEGRRVRGQGEIVGKDLNAQRDPSGEHYRHSLRWVSMDADLKAALAELLQGSVRGAEPPSGPGEEPGPRGGAGGTR